MEQTECSETSAYKIQTPGNYPEESIQHSEHGESLKSRKMLTYFLKVRSAKKTKPFSLGGGGLKINAVKKTSMLQNVTRALYMEHVMSGDSMGQIQ
jgi:hypothetical protein